MERTCSNCEWCISPEMEENIIEEQGYDIDDPSRPVAGDCCLGKKGKDKSITTCSSHCYIYGMEEFTNYVVYDEEYLGEGYLLISKLDNDVIKFMKISCEETNGFLSFSIRGFEKDAKDSPNSKYRKIQFTISSDDALYETLYQLSIALDGNKVYSIDKSSHGENHLEVNSYLGEVEFNLVKDVFGVKMPTDFIDIYIGDQVLCECYDAVSCFYKGLSKHSKDIADEDTIKQILKLSKEF